MPPSGAVAGQRLPARNSAAHEATGVPVRLDAGSERMPCCERARSTSALRRARAWPSRACRAGRTRVGGPPRPGAARLPALHHRPCSNATTVIAGGSEATRQELVAAQQEVGIGRPAVRLVAHRKRLVEQHAVGRERGAQVREERPVQVVDDDDGVEALALRAATLRSRDRATRVSMPSTFASADNAAASRSTARTRAPRDAKKRAWRPPPAARSSTRAPAGTSGAKRTIHGEGSSVCSWIIASPCACGR